MDRLNHNLIKALRAMSCVVLAFLTIAIAPLCAGAPTPDVAGPSGDTAPERSEDARRINAAVQAELERMKLDPRAAHLTSQRVERFRAMVEAKDFAAAGNLIATVWQARKPGHWQHDPVGSFMEQMGDLDNPRFEERLTDWIARDATNPVPLLLRAEYLHRLAWHRRGTEYSAETPTPQLIAFNLLVKRALADVNQSLRLNPDNPYAVLLRLRMLGNDGLSKELMIEVEKAINAYPTYYPLYEVGFRATQPRWGGSVEAMHGFVNRYAGKADETSPVRMLYLSLYRHLLRVATESCRRNLAGKGKFSHCVAHLMATNSSPELQPGIQSAAWLFRKLDKGQFGPAIDELLYDVMTTRGAERSAIMFLQTLAEGMDVTIEMAPQYRMDRYYAIDKAVALAWFINGHYDNALTKIRDALRNVEATTFPDVETRQLAISGIYQVFARIHGQQDRAREIVIYRTLHAMLGGPNQAPAAICYAYFMLGDHASAIDECSRLIEQDEHSWEYLHFWRGKAFEAIGRTDDVIRDFTLVADSGQKYRGSAAIGLSVVHFARKETKEALNVLNRYEFLYDPKVSDQETIAISYNNRCFGYMLLGQLRRALDDCNKSLGFGTIPDAVAKRQDLIKRLNMRERSL